jgi:SAM-dependent methyltransferase
MEHVSNPREVLSEVRRILRPEGLLILQVPNIDSWQSRIFGAQWYGLDIPRHVIDYSKAAILRLLADAGFHVRRVRHFNLRDNAPALVSTIFPSLDPVGRAVRHHRHNMRETVTASWARHLSYLFFVFCAYPAAMIESAFGHGATIMIEAGKK